VPEALAQLWHTWDDAFKVPADEYERAELVKLPRGAAG
jgi:hypothetical protein